MKKLSPGLIRLGQTLIILGLFLIGFLILVLASGNVHPAYALPEYTNRTGESCGTCHVNAGGGGPRTLRGLLWAAQGRPDEIPELPGMLIAPAEITDGLELYDIACAGCHGNRGQGLFAIHLAETGVSRPAVRSFIVRGIPLSGMPAFEGQFTEDQLESLVDFVTGLTNGEITIEEKYALPPAKLECIPISEEFACPGK